MGIDVGKGWVWGGVTEGLVISAVSNYVLAFDAVFFDFQLILLISRHLPVITVMFLGFIDIVHVIYDTSICFQ